MFWLHGGGFVAGDKEGVEEFATYLVADTAYTVVSVNYQLAPSSHYPGQLLQFGQAIEQASVVDYVTDKFPPTFVTDGNSYSFQEQGLTLVDRLKELNAPVTSLFFNDSAKR